jgi:hypothetical protein
VSKSAVAVYSGWSRNEFDASGVYWFGRKGCGKDTPDWWWSDSVTRGLFSVSAW